MDLYSPEDDEINQQVVELLITSGYESSVSIGGSRIGTKSFWYSTKTGIEIDFKFSPREFARDNIWINYCLQLVKTSNDYQFQDSDCFSGSNNFICEAIEN